MTLVIPNHGRCPLRHTEKETGPRGWQRSIDPALSRRCSATELREMKNGSPTWPRTTDLLVNSQVLCQLRYRGMNWCLVTDSNGRPAG